MEKGKFEALEKSMCKELENLEHKVQSAPEMSTADLDKIDKLAHALKSLATYKAMAEASEYEEPGYSGRRGRNSYNGQYMSRDMSYDDGMSGRYPYRGDWPPYSGIPWR